MDRPTAAAKPNAETDDARPASRAEVRATQTRYEVRWSAKYRTFGNRGFGRIGLTLQGRMAGARRLSLLGGPVWLPGHLRLLEVTRPWCSVGGRIFRDGSSGSESLFDLASLRN